MTTHNSPPGKDQGLNLLDTALAHYDAGGAVIEWPAGLDGAPVIRAIGESAEASKKILKYLETRLELETCG